MNDIILKGASLKRELSILFISFLVAFGVNVYAIIVYNTGWGEIFTALGFVAILTVIFYVVVAIVRLLIKGIKTIVKGKVK